MSMKPHKHLRKGDGYCCERDDGPYSSWKKKVRRTMKRSDKAIAQKEISKYKIVAKPSKPSFSKAMIEKMMKKK